MNPARSCAEVKYNKAAAKERDRERERERERELLLLLRPSFSLAVFFSFPSRRRGSLHSRAYLNGESGKKGGYALLSLP